MLLGELDKLLSWSLRGRQKESWVLLETDRELGLWETDMDLAIETVSTHVIRMRNSTSTLLFSLTFRREHIMFQMPDSLQTLHVCHCHTSPHLTFLSLHALPL